MSESLPAGQTEATMSSSAHLLRVALVLIISMNAAGSMYGFTTKASGTLREQREREEKQLIPRLQVNTHFVGKARVNSTIDALPNLQILYSILLKMKRLFNSW